MRAGLEALPDDLRRNIIIWVSAIAVFIGFVAFLQKRFDWQRLEPARTCTHCLKIHSVAGLVSTVADILTLAALGVLGLDPYFAALKAQAFDPLDCAILLLIAAAWVVFLIGSGFLVRFGFGARTGIARSDAASNLFAGTRLAALIVALWMFPRGAGRAAIGLRLDDTFGFRLGERLQAAIGVVAVRDTLVVMLAGLLISALARWIVPVVVGSRPLILIAPKASRVIGR